MWSLALHPDVDTPVITNCAVVLVVVEEIDAAVPEFCEPPLNVAPFPAIQPTCAVQVRELAVVAPGKPLTMTSSRVRFDGTTNELNSKSPDAPECSRPACGVDPKAPIELHWLVMVPLSPQPDCVIGEPPWQATSGALYIVNIPDEAPPTAVQLFAAVHS